MGSGMKIYYKLDKFPFTKVLKSISLINLYTTLGKLKATLLQTLLNTPNRNIILLN